MHVNTSTSPRPTDSDSLTEIANQLLRAEIDFIPHSDFQNETAQAEIMADGTFAEVSAAPATSRVPQDLPAHLARLCATELLTAEQERELFRRMNYLKCRANSLRTALQLDTPDAALVDEIYACLLEAQAIRDHIVNANMRLVMSVVKKFVTPQLSFDDMLSDGIFLLVQCVDKFDFSRGFRFSTYAYRSIARGSYRKVTELQKEFTRYISANSSESGFEIAGDEQGAASLDEHTWSTLRELLAGMMDQLDRREQFVIRGRYALGAHRKVRTFQSLADKLGVSKERVRQLEQRAVRKLQSMAASVELDELGAATPAVDS